MANLLFGFAFTTTLAILVNVAASQSSYCKMPTCEGKPHTGCQYPANKMSSACGKVQTSTLTPAEEKELLDAHNYYRALVASGKETRGYPGPQPAAVNLGSLKWDAEIAKIAQTWADQCNYGHDSCRDTATYSVGQNVAIKGFTGNIKLNHTDMVTMWYDEVADFNSNTVGYYDPKSSPNVTGHYTQMMWAETTHVGCGAVRYKKDGWNWAYLVCNYGPKGNWLREEIYKTKSSGNQSGQKVSNIRASSNVQPPMYKTGTSGNSAGQQVFKTGPSGNGVGPEVYKTGPSGNWVTQKVYKTGPSGSWVGQRVVYSTGSSGNSAGQPVYKTGSSGNWAGQPVY